MELVGVIGGGTMGAGIAEVCAKAGSSVLVLETKEEFAAAARERIAKSINRGVAKGKITQKKPTPRSHASASPWTWKSSPIAIW